MMGVVLATWLTIDASLFGWEGVRNEYSNTNFQHYHRNGIESKETVNYQVYTHSPPFPHAFAAPPFTTYPPPSEHNNPHPSP